MNISPELAVAIGAGIIVLVPIAIFIFRKIPKRLKHDAFMSEWQHIQGYCKDKTLWSKAITEADVLFDKSLKRRKIKGKSMGERMVNAQKMFTNNDATWFGHNLAKKLTTDAKLRLREDDVKNALIGFRQGLRDIGALPDPKEQAAAKEEANDK